MNSGRVVVITGAGGGMGSLVVDRFLANGDIVIATDASAETLESLGQREGLHIHTADISSEAECDGLATFAQDRTGRVDVLVNCAGYFPLVPFEELTADQFRRVIDINLTGTFLMVKALLPLMKGRGWGRVVNFGSASIFSGVATQAHYVAAKAGVVGLSRSMARALGGEGITVNVITPGLTVTPAVREKMPAAMLEMQVRLRAIQREELPEDLVGTAFFLASPDADFISGQTINVDGGRTML